MKHMVLIVLGFGALVLASNAYAQSDAALVEQALAAAPRRASADASVVNGAPTIPTQRSRKARIRSSVIAGQMNVTDNPSPYSARAWRTSTGWRKIVGFMQRARTPLGSGR